MSSSRGYADDVLTLNDLGLGKPSWDTAARNTQADEIRRRLHHDMSHNLAVHNIYCREQCSSKDLIRSPGLKWKNKKYHQAPPAQSLPTDSPLFTPVRDLSSLADDLGSLRADHHQAFYSGDSETTHKLREFWAPNESFVRPPALAHLCEPAALTRNSFGSDAAFDNYWRDSEARTPHAYTLLLREDGGCPDAVAAAADVLGVSLRGVESSVKPCAPNSVVQVDGRSDGPKSPSAVAWLPPFSRIAKDPPPRPSSYASVHQADPSTEALRAILGGQAHELDQLLLEGLNPSAVVRGKPLLIHATEKGHSGIMSRLLHARADPNRGGSDGLSALQVAIESGQPHLASLIIQESTEESRRIYMD